MLTEQNYISSLNHFLDASHEDEVDVAAILLQLPKCAPQLDNAIRIQKNCTILDVGSGNAKKSALIAAELERRGIQPIVDCIDPKAGQFIQIRTSFASHADHLRLTAAKTFESFNPAHSYDLIVFLHSLYEFPRTADGCIESLARIPSLLAAHGACAIILEDVGGDFQKIKHEFIPTLGGSEQFSIPMLERSLQTAQVKYVVGDQIDLRLPIEVTLPSRELGRTVEFLFSESFQNGGSLTDEQLEQAGDWMKCNAKIENGQHYVWVPNRVVWCRK